MSRSLSCRLWVAFLSGAMLLGAVLAKASLVFSLAFATYGSEGSETTELASNLKPGWTILNGEAELAPNVSGSDVAAWKAELVRHPSRDRRCRLLVQTAEWEIAHQEPAKAKPLLEEAVRISSVESLDRGLAEYDLAVIECIEGRFDASVSKFGRLLASKSVGYNRRNAALWMRHAAGCAGYHREHWELGIPQPAELDPLCGASSMAMCLKVMGLPHAKQLVVSKVKHTGEGSTMRDLVEAAPRFGLVGKFVLAEEEGFKALPKPLVAHVERDHFVTVLSTNERGVDYTCSDCGPWPGGLVQVTWKQWRAMEADAYLVLSKPGSVADEALSALAYGPTGESAEHVYVASTTPSAVRAEALFGRLRGKAWQGSTVGGNNPKCGGRPGSLQCIDQQLGGPICPEDCGPTFTADPVNVATGQEEYATPTALNIYNPFGPSVVWRPMYYSLANVTPNGFGSGWTHPYNYRIEGTAFTQGAGGHGTVTLSLVFPNSGKLHFTIDLDNPPTPANPSVVVPVEVGYGLKVAWVAESFSGSGTLATSRFEVKSKNGGVMRFETSNTTGVAYPTKVFDKVGNWIGLNWSTRSFLTIDPFQYGGPTKGLDSITSSSGTTLLSLTYGSWGRLQRAADCYGRYVHYTLVNLAVGGSSYASSTDELSTVSYVTTNSASGTTQYSYAYNSYGNSGGPGPDSESIPYLTGITTASPTGSGNSTAVIVHGLGGLVQETVDANGNVTKYKTILNQSGGTVPNATRVEKWTPSPGSTRISWRDLYYNGQMNTTRVSGPSETVWTYGSPNTPNRPSQVQDGNNRVWQYTWDQFGQLLTSTTPKNVTTTYTYDTTSWPFGRLSEIQTGSLLSTQLDYWSNGLLKEVRSPVPGNVGGSTRQSTTYTYDTLGNLLTVTEPGNAQYATRTTTLGYGATPKLGQPLTVTNAQGKVTTLGYDSHGNLTSVTDPLGNSTLATYDLLDGQISVQAPPTGNTGIGRATTVTNYAYPGGPVNSVVAYDEAGAQVRQVSFTYGAEGELLTRTGSTENVALTYDAAYRVKTMSDGMGHTTTHNYDVYGRPTSTVQPGNTGGTADKVTFDTYDSAGNLTQLTDGRGTVKKFHYDDVDGLLSWIEYAGVSGQDVALNYDTLDRTSSVVDGTGTSSWTYDDLGGVLTGTRTYTGLAAKTFTYAYNPDGSRLSMATPAGNFTYQYDQVGRPKQFSCPGSTVVYSYLDNGWLWDRSVWTGLAYRTVEAQYTYNNAGLLTSVTNRGGSNNAVRSQYSSLTYDGAFNLTGLTAYVPQGPALQSGTSTYTYDSKNRLLQESGTRFKSGGYNDTFGYDNAGNPTTVFGQARTYGVDNEQSPGTYTYDGNGNLAGIGAGQLQFAYDAEDRCTWMGYGGVPDFQAGYRADGLRAWKQSSQTGGTKRYYLYDGGMPLVELDASGNVAAVNAFAPDGLVSRASGGTTVYYSFDQQGNISGRTDSAGAIISSSGYAAFGYSASFGESQSASFTDPFGFNAQWGYYLDREHGYYLCGHRYYGRNGGRWLTRDPIGVAGGVNLYSYCGQGPVGKVDPEGTSFLVPAVVIAEQAAKPLAERTTYLYQLFDRTSGEYLKTGLSWNPDRRYSGVWLLRKNAEMKLVGEFSNRAECSAAERAMIRANPGDWNKELWARLGERSPGSGGAAPGIVTVATGAGVFAQAAPHFINRRRAVKDAADYAMDPYGDSEEPEAAGGRADSWAGGRNPYGGPRHLSP